MGTAEKYAPGCKYGPTVQYEYYEEDGKNKIDKKTKSYHNRKLSDAQLGTTGQIGHPIFTRVLIKPKTTKNIERKLSLLTDAAWARR